MVIDKSNKIRMNTKNVFFFLVFTTSSYDIFLNLRLGGFSFRFVYLLVILLLVAYLYKSFKNRLFNVKYIGLNSFLVWLSFLLIFITNTPLIGRNIGYIIWLILHFVLIVVTNSYIKKKNAIIILKLYLISFICNSIIGFIQLAAGLAGVNFYIEQWWIQDRLPRLNGFSYEPSYYSTYLMIGFSVSYFLYRKGVLFDKLTKITVISTFLGIMLSTSRMGILVAIIQIFLYEILIDRKSIKKIFLFIISFSFVLLCLLFYLLTNENLSFLLAGLGIMGGSAHSSLERLDGFITQLEIFSRNPFKGYSLGGVSQAIAREKGVTVISQENIKIFDVSINIFIEVLTASGILGFLFFLKYIYMITIKTWNSYTNTNADNRVIMQAIVWGLIFELIILCFNQNILRAYLWVHIAVLNNWYFATKSSNSDLGTDSLYQK